MIDVKIARPSTRLAMNPEDHLLVKEIDGAVHGSSSGDKLGGQVRGISWRSRSNWSVQKAIEGYEAQIRRATTSAVKQLQVKPSDFRPTLAVLSRQ